MPKPTITCPACKAKISHLIEWSDIAIGYKINANGHFGKPLYGSSADFNSYVCPECDTNFCYDEIQTLFTNDNSMAKGNKAVKKEIKKPKAKTAKKKK